MKLAQFTLAAVSLALAALAPAAHAGDNLKRSGTILKGGDKFELPEAPILAFYTRKDNDGPGGVPDGDIRVYVCDGDPLFPIETAIPVKADPSGYSKITLRVRAIDVDSADGEASDVWLNGTFLGYLTGADSTLSETEFTVPGGVVVEGKNFLTVGQQVPGWCNSVQAAIITLTP